jgi:hypothetical protein
MTPKPPKGGLIYRLKEMERYIIKVIRFTNSEVENNIEDVVKLKELNMEFLRKWKVPPGGFRGGFAEG